MLPCFGALGYTGRRFVCPPIAGRRARIGWDFRRNYDRLHLVVNNKPVSDPARVLRREPSRGLCLAAGGSKRADTLVVSTAEP